MALMGREEPRVWTPPLRELTPETTLGFDVIGFSADTLGIDPLPWERWLLVHALEIEGDFGGDWWLRFRVVLVLVARQNGKTFVSMLISLFFLYVLAAKLVLGTAQDLSQAEETWEAAVGEATGNAELAAEVERIFRGKGSKELRLDGYRRYKVATPNRRNTRGKSCELVLLDELREHQTFDAWSAASKTIKARRSAVVWCMSNAGDGASVVLRHLRMQAHKAIGDPDGVAAASEASEPSREEAEEAEALSRIGIFEWSAPAGCDKWDRDAWAQANPSLGYGFLDESAIATDCAADPEIEFRTEDLCQWSEAVATPPFPVGAWEGGLDPASEMAGNAAIFLGVDVAADRTRTSVAACGMRPDGRWHGELIAYRNGSRWLVEWFRRNVPAIFGGHVAVALQGRGAPVSAYADVLASIEGVEVVECKGRDLGAWCGRLWDAVAASAPGRPGPGGGDAQGRDGGSEGPEGSDHMPVMHRPQPRLDVAAGVAVTRPAGDGTWVWDRARSPEDISPLVALTMAFGLATEPEPERPPESAYAEDGLLVLE